VVGVDRPAAGRVKPLAGAPWSRAMGPPLYTRRSVGQPVRGGTTTTTTTTTTTARVTDGYTFGGDRTCALRA
jgi:hypothetical protein